MNLDVLIESLPEEAKELIARIVASIFASGINNKINIKHIDSDIIEAYNKSIKTFAGKLDYERFKRNVPNLEKEIIPFIIGKSSELPKEFIPLSNLFLLEIMKSKAWNKIEYEQTRYLQSTLNLIEQNIQTINSRLSADKEEQWSQIWRNYNSLIEETPFGFNELDGICLKDVFIPPDLEIHFNGYSSEFEKVNHLVNFKIFFNSLSSISFKAVKDILKQKKKSDNSKILNRINFISGEPGVGKSTITKFMASQLSDDNQKVVLLEAQNITIEINDLKQLINLIDSTLDFEINNYLKTKKPKHFTLIIDGIDEYNPNSIYSEDKINMFIRILRQLKKTFKQHSDIDIFVSGRPIVIQKVKLDFDVTIKVLPLHYENCSLDYRIEFLKKINTNQVALNTSIFLCDQDVDYYGLTVYPITLIILFQSIISLPELDIKELNKFSLYENVFSSYYKRETYTKDITVIANLSKEEFYSIVENIAFLAWKNGDVRRYYKKNISEKEFNIFKSNLLIRHYVNVSTKENLCLEFIHKSFGEYFLVTYLTKQLKSILSSPYTHDGFESYFKNLFTFFKANKFDEYLKEWFRYSSEYYIGRLEQDNFNKFMHHYIQLTNEKSERIMSNLFDLKEIDKKFLFKKKNFTPTLEYFALTFNKNNLGNTLKFGQFFNIAAPII